MASIFTFNDVTETHRFQMEIKRSLFLFVSKLRDVIFSEREKMVYNMV